MTVEHLEPKMMLTGPQLVGITPNADELLQNGDTRNVELLELIFRFNEGQIIDPNDPKYHRYDADYVTHVPEGLIKFCKAAAVLVVCIGGAVWIAQFASAKRLPFQFPPYVESPQDNRPNP